MNHYEPNPLSVSEEISTLIEKNLYSNRKMGNANVFLSPVQIQEVERIKLGQELHDDVNPSLAAAKLCVQMAAEQTKEGKKAMKLALSAIMSAMDSIRKLSADMVVAQKNDFCLVDGTKKFLKTVTSANIFKINCRFSKDFVKCYLTNEQQICLYRIVQEQMNNIIKYSHATNVDIHLTCKRNICIMEIKDDGVGCDLAVRPAGIGLMNIANRVEQLYGKMTIITSPGEGFLLHITLPIKISVELGCEWK